MARRMAQRRPVGRGRGRMVTGMVQDAGEAKQCVGRARHEVHAARRKRARLVQHPEAQQGSRQVDMRGPEARGTAQTPRQRLDALHDLACLRLGIGQIEQRGRMLRPQAQAVLERSDRGGGIAAVQTGIATIERCRRVARKLHCCRSGGGTGTLRRPTLTRRYPPGSALLFGLCLMRGLLPRRIRNNAGPTAPRYSNRRND